MITKKHLQDIKKQISKGIYPQIPQEMYQVLCSINLYGKIDIEYHKSIYINYLANLGLIDKFDSSNVGKKHNLTKEGKQYILNGNGYYIPAGILNRKNNGE